jgi:hypothetical protein
MNRRTVLAGLGVAAAAALSGCTQSAPNSEGETTMDDTTVPDSRADEPPYEIESPDSDDPEGWNDEYLGEHMPTEPSLPFERIRSARLADPSLQNPDGEAYHIRLLRDADERDAVLDLEATDEDARERLEAVDFEESVLVVVESGFGSSSVDHRWARVEDAADGIHLHGYYTDPFEQLSDIDAWHSVLEVERPNAGPDLARVSLTVDERRRVHFDSTSASR